MPEAPILPSVTYITPVPNEGDATIEMLLAELITDGIERVEWTVYWYSDQTEFHSADLFAADGTHQQTLYDGDLPSVWEAALWRLIDVIDAQESYGTFELAVAERRVSHTGDAWMPEPELETLPFAPDRVVTRSF